MTKIINFFKGLSKEHRRIRWITLDDLWPQTFIVLGFALAFGIFFVGVDIVVTWVMKYLKVVN